MEPPVYGAEIRALFKEVQPVVAETAVILVICIRDRTRLRRDYNRYSVASSFLNAIELDDLLGSLRSRGLYVQHFDDEIGFISWVLSGAYAALPHKNKIVYTEAANGTGPGRRTLIPAFCALEGIPTMNSDAYSCAINRHKYHWSRLLETFGLPVPQSWSYDAVNGWFQRERPPCGTRVIGKSTFEDSSIGVSHKTVGIFAPELERNIDEVSRNLQQPITVQRFVAGLEVEVPVFELERHIAPSPIVIVKSNGTMLHDDVLVYDEVWDDQYQFQRPDNLTVRKMNEISDIAIQASKALGFRGFSRIDFRIDREGQPFIIDVSTTPHLIRTSSYAFLFEILGFDYADMLYTMVASGLKRHGMLQSSVQNCKSENRNT